MCTLSWTPSAEGYGLVMNRDERRTRAKASPPVLLEPPGLSAMAPVDGEAQGSWIAVNARGHSLALLNRWEDSPLRSEGAFVSRGILVLALARLEDTGKVRAALQSANLQSYRPFTLVSLTPGSSPHAFDWNGSALSDSAGAEPGMIRTSSGSDQAGAERVRGALFREARERKGRLTLEDLVTLHRSHEPVRGPLSICMHREEATTVSCSVITVSPRLVSFRYMDGPPGEFPPETEHLLDRDTRG